MKRTIFTLALLLGLTMLVSPAEPITKILVDTDSAQTLTNKSLDFACNVKTDGATGDGSTNDAAAINTTFDDPDCSTIVFPPGTYIIQSRIEENRSNVRVVGYGATIKKGGSFSAGTGINTMMAVGAAATITADRNFEDFTAYSISDPTQGSATLTFTTGAETSNFQAGDVVVIKSNELYGAENPVLFEYNEVLSVASPNVTLKNEVRFFNETTWAYEIINISRATNYLISNVEVEGLTFDDNSATTGSLFVSLFVRNGHFHHLAFTPSSSSGLFGLYYSWNVQADHNRIVGVDGDGTGIITAGIDTFSVDHNTLSHLARAIQSDIITAWGSFSQNRMDDMGEYCFIVVDNYYVSFTDNIGMNCDDFGIYIKNSKYYSIENNQFHYIIDTANFGDNIRAFYDGSEVASNTNYQNVYSVIRGNTLVGSDGVPIRLHFRSTPTTTYINYVVVKDNLTVNGGEGGIMVSANSTFIESLGNLPSIAAVLTVNADTTPDVSNGSLFTVTNSGGTTITAFDNCQAGKIFTLLFTDANTTVTDGGTIALSAVFTSTANDTMSFYCDGTNAYETARAVN